MGICTARYSVVLFLSFLPRTGVIGELGGCRWVVGLISALLVLLMVDCWVVYRYYTVAGELLKGLEVV